MILDGKVFASDRCSEPMTSVKGEQVDAWYSGKAHRHGGNVQAVMRPGGLPLWVGPADPGSVHDVAAARRHALPALYRAAALGMPCLADSGYEGAGIGILVPVKRPAGNQEFDIDTRTRNALLRDLRCRGERRFALLTQRWAALQHITADPDRNHRDNLRHTRPHPIRAQIHQLKLGETTSLASANAFTFRLDALGEFQTARDLASF